MKSRTAEESELKTIVTALQSGTHMTWFTSQANKQTNKVGGIKLKFAVDLDEFTISWQKRAQEKFHVYIEEIKEVRRGCASKDFQTGLQYIEDPNCCLAIVYGSEFKLHTLSCMARNYEEREEWVKGLVYLRWKNQYAPPITLSHRWLRRLWAAESTADLTPMKKFKELCRRANIQLSSDVALQCFQEVHTNGVHLSLNKYYLVYQKLISHPELCELFGSYFHHNGTETCIPFDEFKRFLIDVQNDERAIVDLRYIKNLIRSCHSTPDKEAPLSLSVTQFLDFLYSADNCVFRSICKSVYQDMTKPLSHYWIASSQNTYLCGDQLTGESSVESIVRCLKMGARCIQLHCWDGPDPPGDPLVHHGLTPQSKMRLSDVLVVIKKYAFMETSYPLIISLMQQCSLQQQRSIANLIKKHLGGKVAYCFFFNTRNIYFITGRVKN